MEYNVHREPLHMPEYGRYIQEMADYVCNIPDKKERTEKAYKLIDVMGNLFPFLRDAETFKNKLWSHLAIISDYKLDIDYPCEIPDKEEHFSQKPEKISYDNPRYIKLKHYGKNIQDMIHQAVEMEDGEHKKHLTNLIANHLKKSHIMWNTNSVENEQIIKDLRMLCKDKLDTSEVTMVGRTQFMKIIAPSKKQKNFSKKIKNKSNH